MSSQRPPFRADHVGSLLRPASVAEARRKCLAEKTMPEEELRAIEDEAIAEAIRLQEDIGLKAVTDGEYRRLFWHYDFMGMLTGFEFERREQGVQFAGVQIPPLYPTITGKLDFPDDHPMLDHFKFVASQRERPAQDLHPGSELLPFPHRAGRHPCAGIWRHGRAVRRHRGDLPEGNSGRSTTPAAATSSSTTSSSPISAIPGTAPRRRRRASTRTG